MEAAILRKGLLQCDTTDNTDCSNCCIFRSYATEPNNEQFLFSKKDTPKAISIAALAVMHHEKNTRRSGALIVWIQWAMRDERLTEIPWSIGASGSGPDPQRGSPQTKDAAQLFLVERASVSPLFLFRLGMNG